jgi:hypothetical protein
MLIDLAFKKCKQTHHNPKYLMNNRILNLGDRLCHALQNSWIWTFILQCVGLMCLKLWDIG